MVSVTSVWRYIKGLHVAARLAMERGSSFRGLGHPCEWWEHSPEVMGPAGLADDLLLRASVQCLGGIIANDLAEGVYLNTTFVSAKGRSHRGLAINF
jgi:hypothetical protein